MATLKTGALAFIDSMSGPVPCKVLSIQGKSGPCSSDQSVKVRVTATRPGWPRGMEWEDWGLRIIPRGALIRRRNCSARITRYDVEADAS